MKKLLMLGALLAGTVAYGTQSAEANHGWYGGYYGHGYSPGYYSYGYTPYYGGWGHRGWGGQSVYYSSPRFSFGYRW